MPGLSIPLPKSRPDPNAQLQPATNPSIPYIQESLQAAYGNKCQVPPQPESIPDDNPYFSKYGYTRESFLDVFIQNMIDAGGFDPAFATEFCTGLYGIESHYGDNPANHSGASTNCTGSYCGPLQIDMIHYNQWYIKIGKNEPAVDTYLNATAQIISVTVAAKYGYNTLKTKYPNGTWRSKTIEPFDLYMMHQLGPFIGNGGYAGYQSYINKGPDYAPVSDMYGWEQSGHGTLYGPNSTIRQMIAAQKTNFDESAVRVGGDNCGEFAVEFLAGAG